MSQYLLDAKLAHLSDEQVASLIIRYYEGEKIKSLLSEFEILSLPNQFNKILPRVVQANLRCTACGAPMVKILQSRHKSNTHNEPYACSSCSHLNSISCRCVQRMKLAQDAKFAEQFTHQSLISAYCNKYSPAPRSVSVADISLRVAVSLLAMVRTCQQKNDGTYGSISNNPIPFSPEGNFGFGLIKMLFADALIAPSDSSTPYAFSIEDGKVVSFFIETVDWKLNFASPELLISQIEECGLNGVWPYGWNDAVNDLKMDIALAECKEFYEHCLYERELFFNAGTAVDSMLLNLLRDHSVAQCMRIIWGGAQSAVDFKARNKTTSQHAANYMVGACQRWADRARAESWEVKGFRRNFKLPRSMLSYILYDVILKTGERGFTECVSQ
ncbi:MAG: hypothetical protein Q7S94_00865 [Gallionella sp.]|nr:hypothetical protein [Gallionella sp.]